MFQFGPFGGSKKTQQPTDPVSQLTALAKQIVDDPSVLNQNLREVCQHLGTPLHDKADQLLGTMVAGHSSRMLSTLWTVLLQRLRESAQEPRAQLAMLRHFSQIAGRISIPQRANAFRVFAKEASNLCEKQELVADRSFGRSFVAVVQALGVHADAELCHELLDKTTHAVFAWTRLDARRAAATLVACIVGTTSCCGTFGQFLRSIKDREDPIGKALLVDATTGPALEQAQRLQEAGGRAIANTVALASSPIVREFQDVVGTWLCSIWSATPAEAVADAGAAPPAVLSASDTTVVPLLVASLSKLRAADPSGWAPADSEMIRGNVLRLLSDDRTRKVLICPLLSLLRALPLPAASSSMAEASLSAVERRCADDDSMTRCEAFGALEALLPILDSQSTVPRLVASALARHSALMQERCNVTIRGILGFLAAAYPRVQHDVAATSMLHTLTRAHLDLSNTVNIVPTVQLQMLSMLEHTVAYLSAGSTSYILFCLHSTDMAVREKAIRVLVRLSEAASIDRMQLFDTVPRGLDFLEDAYASHSNTSSISGALQHHLNNDDALLRLVRNIGIMMSYFSHLLTTQAASTGGDKASAATVQTSCEAVGCLGRHLRDRLTLDASWQRVGACGPHDAGAQQAPGERRSHGATTAIGAVMPSMYVSLLRMHMDLFNSVVTLPLDVVTTVLDAAAVCCDGCSPTDCFDIYLHKSSFNLVWNMLHRCCAAIDPMSVPRLHQEPSLYLSHAPLHKSLEALVHQAGQSALSSAERQENTNFYKLVQNCVTLLLSLARWGRKSPVFVAHMRHQYRFILVCLDILASSHPLSALQACRDFFVIMFFEGGEEDPQGDTQPSGGSIATGATVLLSSTVPALQRTKYVSASVSILNRSLSFDLSTVGGSLFALMRLFISVDTASNETTCYRSIDESLSLFKRMADIACDGSYYNVVYGSTVAKSVLATLFKLYASPHQQAISDITPLETLLERVGLVLDGAKSAIGGGDDSSLFADAAALVADAQSTVRHAVLSAQEEAGAEQWLAARIVMPPSDLSRHSLGNRPVKHTEDSLAVIRTWLKTSATTASVATIRRYIELGLELGTSLRCSVDVPPQPQRETEGPDDGAVHGETATTATTAVEEELHRWRRAIDDDTNSIQTNLLLLLVASALEPSARLPALVAHLLGPTATADVAPTHREMMCDVIIQWLQRMDDASRMQLCGDDAVFPDISPEHLRCGSIEAALLDACCWCWSPPPPEATLWDVWYPRASASPVAQSAVPRSIPLLRYVTQHQLFVPERALFSSHFWLECVSEFPDLPTIFVQQSPVANEDPTTEASSEVLFSSPLQESHDDDATDSREDIGSTQACVVAMMPLLQRSAGATLARSRILATSFIEVVPFVMHVDGLRAALSKEDATTSYGQHMWSWLEAHLLPEGGADAGDDDGVADEEDACPESMVGLILDLPRRGLAMKDLSAEDLGVTDLSKVNIKHLHRYIREAAGCVTTEEKSVALFHTFLHVLQFESLHPPPVEGGGATNPLPPSATPESIIAFANAFIRCQVRHVAATPDVVLPLWHLFIDLLRAAHVEDEKTLSLRYSVMFLVVILAPDRQQFWQRVLDGDEEQVTMTNAGPQTSCDDSEQAYAPWLPLGPPLLTILCLVLELPTPPSPSSQDGDEGGGAVLAEVARYTVSIFLRSSALSAGIQESILWLVTKCCSASVWAVVYKEALCSATELAVLKFLCKMSQTVGMSQHLVQEIHARYTPLLLSFGSSRSELDADEQRMVFWLITSLLLHTVISEERHTKPKPHMSLADALYLYVDYPLASMSQECAVRIRKKADDFMFPFFARMPAASSERNWNLHTRGQLLPVCGRHSLSKAAAEKMFTSILHMYAHVVRNVFENVSTMTVEAVTDVFFSLSTLSAGNASLLKHSPALEGTIGNGVLLHVYSWYRKYCSSALASVDSKNNVLNFRMGLFPESSANLEFTDTFSVVSSANIISSLFVRGNELIPGAVDVNFIMEKLLCMDIVSHQAALSTVIVMSGTSTRKEMSRIAPLFTQRLFRDLDVCCKGALSTSFGVMGLLRSAFSIVAAIPDDSVSMKVCEAVWNGIVVRGLGGRRVQHYAHFLLQSIISMSTVSHNQWCVLRALIQTSSHPSGLGQSFASSSRDNGNRGGPVSNNSFGMGATPPPKPKLSFAEGMREKLDRILDLDDTRHDPNDHYLIAVRQSSISSYVTPLTSQTPSAHPSDAHSVGDPSEAPIYPDGHTAADPQRFVFWTSRLLTLTTTAAVILRSKTDEEQIDHNRVHVMSLLASVEESPSAAGDVYLFAVKELLSEVLDPNDAMFVVLNRFNFAESSLTLFNCEAVRAIARARSDSSDPKTATMVALPQMTLFFETAFRRLQSYENAWWTLTNLVVALLSLWTTERAVCTAPLMSLLSTRIPPCELRRVCRFVLCRMMRSSPSLEAHTKDVKMFLKSVEGASKAGKDAHATAVTVAVVGTMLQWLANR